MAYRSIPTRVHGVIDYILAISLIAMPWMFDTLSVKAGMSIIVIILGIALFIYSICTYYEVSIFKLMGMWTHVTLDAGIGIVIMALPLVFNMIDSRLYLWVPYLGIGLLLVVQAIISKTAPAGTVTPAM